MFKKIKKNLLKIKGKFSQIQNRHRDQYKKVLVVGCLLILLFSLHKLSIFNNPNLLFDMKWQTLIRINGPETAYAKFLISNQTNSSYIQHRNAHRFGMILYKNFGVEAITYCNDAFGYGCYHNLIGTAISQQGISTVDQLAKRCQTLSNNLAIRSCQHGIGHGLIGYFGYGLTGVQQSIEVCTRIKHLITPNDCGSGIFMEYNFQDMSEDSDKWRSFDPRDPYNPCSSIDPPFQPICTFQQASWWLKSIPEDDENKVVQIDNLCNKLPPIQKAECYKGLSYYLGSYFEWDAGQVIKSCQTLSSRDDQNKCIIQSADIFANGHQLQKEGLQLCQTLDPSQSQQCRQKIGL